MTPQQIPMPPPRPAEPARAQIDDRVRWPRLLLQLLLIPLGLLVVLPLAVLAALGFYGLAIVEAVRSALRR